MPTPKIRVLLAADNRRGAGLLQQRLVQTYGNFWDIRTAAYSGAIERRYVDWNLDALVSADGMSHAFGTRNDNYVRYVNEIKEFGPQLIVSDLELRTSWIGIELGIPVWQVSPLLVHYGTWEQTGAGQRFRANLRLIEETSLRQFVIRNSDKLLVVGHFCDLGRRPTLEPGFEWLRPNFVQTDVVPTITSTATELADALYSGHRPELKIDWKDMETFLMSALCRKYGTALEIDPGVKFLSQHVRESGIQPS